jgi:hypothetical protein
LKKTGAGKPEAGARDAIKLDSKHYKLEFENDQVRVLRIKLGPHEATPMIEEPHNTVAVFLNEREIRTTDAKGAISTAKHAAGEVLWESPNTRKMENTGAAELEMVLIEIRG